MNPGKGVERDDREGSGREGDIRIPERELKGISKALGINLSSDIGIPERELKDQQHSLSYPS